MLTRMRNHCTKITNTYIINLGDRHVKNKKEDLREALMAGAAMYGASKMFGKNQ